MTNGHYRFLLTTTGCCWRLPTIVTHVNLPAEAHTNPWLRSRRYSFRNRNVFYRVETFITGICTDALYQISNDIINYRHMNIFVGRFKLLPKHTCELFDVCLTSGFILQCDSLIRWHDRLQVSDDRLLSEQVDQGQAFDLTDSLDKRKVTFRLWADGK